MTNHRVSHLAAALAGVLTMSGIATQVLAQEIRVDQLAERALNRRAIESVIWGMPAVNAQLMFDAVKKCGGDFNQIVYWSRPLTWKNQTLTQPQHDLRLPDLQHQGRRPDGAGDPTG